VRRPPPEALNLGTWPGVDPKVLEPGARVRYQQRTAAIEGYCRGVSVGALEEKTQVDRRVLYRLIERALAAHPDGRPWGYRALIPGKHTKPYQRTKSSDGSPRGCAGSFHQLLDRHPPLESEVRRLIADREVHLSQIGGHLYLRNLKTAQARFVAACRSLGLSAQDYPLNQEEQGRRSLGATLRERLLGGFAEANWSRRGARLKPAKALAEGHSPGVTGPFDTVEFDAHKLDIRLTILDQDPYGDEQIVEIERVWLLALIDVGTRAILGYTLCLRREYGRYDVIRTIENALKPAQRPTVTIPGLEPLPCGGFASATLPETAYACWRQLRFDNARAHLAADSLNVACELLGCSVDVGPAYEPDDRPFIERFFGTVATQLTHRLPGTTGSSARDALRKLKDPSDNLRLVVSLDELRELLAVWVWNYNGTPHGGLGSGRTPLEAMRAGIHARGILLRQLPPALRQNLCLLHNVHVAHVRGNVSRGEKAHINFYHVRYTSQRLAHAPSLIGKKLRIYYDADDIRVLRAYLVNGTELGELHAGGLWCATPHSLQMRQRIFRARRLRQLRFDQSQDPVEVYLRYKRGQSKRSRKAASEIAQIKDGIRQQRERPTGAPIQESVQSLPLASGVVTARRLRIPSGFA
jgi:putative transposase